VPVARPARPDRRRRNRTHGTDDDMVLGIINPDNFLGGEEMDVQRGREAIGSQCHRPSGHCGGRRRRGGTPSRTRQTDDWCAGRGQIRTRPRDFTLFASGGGPDALPPTPRDGGQGGGGPLGSTAAVVSAYGWPIRHPAHRPNDARPPRCRSSRDGKPVCSDSSRAKSGATFRAGPELRPRFRYEREAGVQGHHAHWPG